MLSTVTPITEVYLSTKERNALELLCVSTVGEFLELDLWRVFDLRGFGATTYSKLKKTRARLQEALFPNNNRGTDTCHLAVKHNDDISVLRLSVRGRKALRRLRVTTVQEFLSLNLANIGPLSNCGTITWEELGRVQTEIQKESGMESSSVLAHPAILLEQSSQDESDLDIVRHPATPACWRKLPLFCVRPVNTTYLSGGDEQVRGRAG